MLQHRNELTESLSTAGASNDHSILSIEKIQGFLKLKDMWYDSARHRPIDNEISPKSVHFVVMQKCFNVFLKKLPAGLLKSMVLEFVECV